uniref:Glutaredoxin and cysteine rich domain containing 2 n=1 Tax=Zosterops lateralis melanops TaxID=1220523 RepID=A0A8D2NKN1_ZOSLA
MEEPQKKQSQRPRKVRFKISSAYSGRVLKQVFEDGQELEPPAKEHSRRFLRSSFEPEDDNGLTLQGECPEPASLVEGTISVYRTSPVVDFGKIIIYTNNLKIIRAPMDQKELMRRMIQTEGINDWTFAGEKLCMVVGRDLGREEFPSSDFGISHPLTEFFFSCSQLQEVDSVYGCSQCKGSGCAPCSLCHGSKFSMLANRFRESYRALRCPACAETGLCVPVPCRVSGIS